MTNIGTLSDLYRGARKLTTACAFAIAIAASVSAQTNTFPSSGNAGIGTTAFDSGTSGLQIQPASRGKFGVLVTDTDGSRAGGLSIDSDGFGHIYLYDSGGTIKVRLAASSGDHTYFNGGGNVGIGTTNPNQKLSVVGTGAFYNSAPVTPSGVRGLFMGNYSGGSSIWSYDYATSQGDPLFITGQDINLSTYVGGNGINRLHISNAGHVGIGTTTPVFDPNTTRYLALNGGGVFGSIGVGGNITHTSNPVGQYAFFNSGLSGSEKRVATIVGLTDGGTNNGRLDFWTAVAGNFTSPKMSIFSNGNVGIGTTSPGARLHLSAGDSSFALFGPNSTWGGSLAVGSGNAFITPISGRAQVLSSNGNLHLDAGTNQFVYIGWLTPSTTIINGQGGSVGIGMSTPNYKLDVNGEINATGLRINGTPISTGGSSQWSGTSGSPIYYTGGNVGIGTNAPSDLLEVNSTTGWGLRVRYVGDGQYLRVSSNQVSSYTAAGVGKDLFLNVDGGKVGIGTTSTQSNLQIGTQAPGATTAPVTLSLGGSFSSAAGANLKLKLYDDGNVGNTYGIGVSSGSMDFGVHSSAGYKWYAGGANKMTLTNTGDLSVTGTINAKYQDVAEWVLSAEQLSAGTVVVLDTAKSNQVIASAASYDTRVAGVISEQPGIALGESGEGKVLVATTGRVRVKVDASRGPIQIGDLLVTSDVPGVAMKSEPVEFAGRKMHMPGTIIGKALEPLAKGKGEILVLLSLQ